MTNVTFVKFSVRRSERRRVRLRGPEGGEFLQARQIKDDESIGGARHEPVTLEWLMIRMAVSV